MKLNQDNTAPRNSLIGVGSVQRPRPSLRRVSLRRDSILSIAQQEDSIPRPSVRRSSTVVHRNSLLGISIHRKRDTLDDEKPVETTRVSRNSLYDISIHRRASFKPSKRDSFVSDCGSFDDDEDLTDSEPTTELSIMSRNLYLGADFLVLAPGQEERDVEQVMQQAIEMTLATDFPARSKALASEILDQQPDVVCLQEVFKYGYSPSEDPNQSVPYLDFLDLLMSNLKGKYKVSAKAKAIHMVIPYDSNSKEGKNFITVDDHDVILTRVATTQEEGIEVLEGSSGVYQAALSMPLINYTGPLIEFKRGYAWVKIRVEDETVLVVNSHLDGILPIQQPQAKELLAVVEELSKDGSHPLLVGDFNATPDGDVYDLLKGEDAQDPFEHDNEPTYAINADLTGFIEEPERIDHIFVPKSLGVVQTNVFGKEKLVELGGMYPTDHFGLTCTVDVSRDGSWA